MEQRSATKNVKITSWKDLIQRLATPARFPRFPEFTSTGEWKPWSAEPALHHAPTTTVQQSKKVPPRFRRLFSNGHQYRRPLQFNSLAEGHIRLLDLKNARTHDNILIGFKLIDVPLSTAPRYEAISYCWGNTDLCTGVLVSVGSHRGQIYRVTENLATCLHSLLISDQSQTDKPRFIWVDQICINQENVPERNLQVRRMDEIYKTAARVIVWLGQVSDFDLGKLDLDVSGEPQKTWEGEPVLYRVIEWSIFARPWFFRMWVVQEAVFAKRIYVLLGTTFMSWDLLQDKVSALVRFSIDMSRAYHSIRDPFFDELGHFAVRIISATARQLRNGESIDLGQLLWRLNEQACQDPRDRVFSLVGFTDNLLPADFVDYNASVEDIYNDCTRLVIAQTGKLEIITYYNLWRDRRPSWVPRWDKRVLAGMSLELPDASASLHRRWRPSTPSTRDALVVSGKRVDSIAVEVKSFSDNIGRFFSNDDFTSALHEPFYEALSQVLCIQATEDRQEAAETRLSDAESRRLTLNALKWPPAAHASFFKEWFGTVFPNRNIMEDDFEILINRPVGAKSLARLQEILKWGSHNIGSLFVLKSGRLGYVQNGTCSLGTEDHVFILHGHDVPCVLHKAEDAEGWLYVAEVHVREIMHGEAVDWKEDEADTFTLV